MDTDYSQIIHFGINDVNVSFQWIYEKQPNSIFDEPLFSSLLKWHMLYNLEFDLYVFEKRGFGILSLLQDRYWNEIKANSKWIRIGWYQVDDGKTVSMPISEQILSAKTVNGLIIEKLSERGCSRIVRLHNSMGEKQLLHALTEFGVHTFLAASTIDNQSYELGSNEKRELFENGHYKDEKGIHYILSDVDLNLLAYGKTADELLVVAQRAYNLSAKRMLIDISFDEKNFARIEKDIEKFLSRLWFIKKKLYLNASAYKDQYLYFTTLNDSYLYRMAVNNPDGIEIVAELPVNKSIKYSNLLFYNDVLWMIPWKERDICAFDVEKKELKKLTLNSDKKYEFVDAAITDNWLWLLPSEGKEIIRINLQLNTQKVFNDFPNEISFSESKKMPFKNISVYDNEVYFFSDSCTHNLIFDHQHDDLIALNSFTHSDFGTIVNSELAVISPTYPREDVILLNMLTGETNAIELPETVWKEAKYYAFWHSKRIDEYSVIIVPHEANAILHVNWRKKTVDIIDIPSHSYMSMRPNTLFSGYDIHIVGDEVWISSYMGNQFIVLKGKTNIKQVVDCDIDLGTIVSFKKSQKINSLSVENEKTNLVDFIDAIKKAVVTRETRVVDSQKDTTQ